MRERSSLPTRWKLALAALALAVAYNAVSLAMASSPRLGVTLVTPWVAPGDTLALEHVVVESRVLGEMPEPVVERLEFPVPSGAAAGRTTTMHIVVNGPLAAALGGEPYNADDVVVTIEAAVLTPLDRTARRVASGLCGAACLALALLFAARVLEPLIRASASSALGARIGGWLIGAPLLLLVVLKGAIQPLAAAFALGGTADSLVGSGLAVVAIALLAKWLCGPRRPEWGRGSFMIKTAASVAGYRTQESVAAPSLDVIAQSIARGRARAELDGTTVVAQAPTWSRAFESRVAISAGEGDSYVVEFNDPALLASVLKALQPERGRIDWAIEEGSETAGDRLLANANSQ